MQRHLTPEILDSLAPDDPRAVRSRRDLQCINALMRGHHWILRELTALDRQDSLQKIVEIGAGTGELTNQLASAFPQAQVCGVDLISAPPSLHPQAQWHQGDLFGYKGYDKGVVVVANLFIHHLSHEALEQLAELLGDVRAIIFAEPHRSAVAKAMGYVMYPFVNEVTKHDMIVSIEAGFVRGELERYFGDAFSIEESLGLCGGLRTKGMRRL